jgi:hypothetical protein
MPPQYKRDEWFRDFKACSSLPYDDDTIDHSMVRDHFLGVYPDKSDALRRADLVSRAFCFLIKYDTKFDDAHLIVIGNEKRRNLITEALVHALWFFYVIGAKFDANGEPDLKCLLKYAIETRAKEKEAEKLG